VTEAHGTLPSGFAEMLIALGGLFLLGLVTDMLGRRTPLPRAGSISSMLKRGTTHMIDG